MRYGVSVNESYDGPAVDAIEFRLHDGNLETRGDIARELLKKAPGISAHLPSFLPSAEVGREVEFDRDGGLISYFVAHVTKRAAFGDSWPDAWREYAACGRRILFENHNQDWHPTDAGLCRAEQFKPIVDAGHGLCLDLGHILYSTMFHTGSDPEWREASEREFEAFLPLPIEAVHVHTVNHFGGVDHQLEGFDVGPWIRRIVEAHPHVILVVEVMDLKYSAEDRVRALASWLRVPELGPAAT